MTANQANPDEQTEVSELTAEDVTATAPSLDADAIAAEIEADMEAELEAEKYGAEVLEAFRETRDAAAEIAPVIADEWQQRAEEIAEQLVADADEEKEWLTVPGRVEAIHRDDFTDAVREPLTQHGIEWDLPRGSGWDIESLVEDVLFEEVAPELQDTDSRFAADVELDR